MNDEHMGNMICKLRKEKRMTQQELANQLHVTDKAVSKWERNLSCPDLTLLPKLAEIFGVTVDDLISSTTIQHDQWQSFKELNKNDYQDMIHLIFKCSSLALAIGCLILNLMDKLSTKDLITFLCISIVLLGFTSFKTK